MTFLVNQNVALFAIVEQKSRSNRTVGAIAVGRRTEAIRSLLADFGATIESEKGIFPLTEGLKSAIVVVHQLSIA